MGIPINIYDNCPAVPGWGGAFSIIVLLYLSSSNSQQMVRPSLHPSCCKRDKNASNSKCLTNNGYYNGGRTFSQVVWLLGCGSHKVSANLQWSSNIFLQQELCLLKKWCYVKYVPGYPMVSPRPSPVLQCAQYRALKSKRSPPCCSWICADLGNGGLICCWDASWVTKWVFRIWIVRFKADIHTLNEHSSICTHKNKVCTAIQLKQQSRFKFGCHGT